MRCNCQCCCLLKGPGLLASRRLRQRRTTGSNWAEPVDVERGRRERGGVKGGGVIVKSSQRRPQGSQLNFFFFSDQVKNPQFCCYIV